MLLMLFSKHKPSNTTLKAEVFSHNGNRLLLFVRPLKNCKANTSRLEASSRCLERCVIIRRTVMSSEKMLHPPISSLPSSYIIHSLSHTRMSARLQLPLRRMKTEAADSHMKWREPRKERGGRERCKELKGVTCD